MPDTAPASRRATGRTCVAAHAATDRARRSHGCSTSANLSSAPLPRSTCPPTGWRSSW
ncbi:hypothetical protein [Actinomadura sp. NPDC048394]|uniref:hypothetical protein n=1 Tax=Actinomadura sp. NPDC048394 TaxID=3158223 RepID=UPI0033DCE6A6